MRRLIVTGFAALLASCANPAKTGPASGPSVASSGTKPAAVRAQTAVPSGQGGAEPPPVASAPQNGVAATGTPGTRVASEFEGCLTQADPMAEKTRSMAPEQPDRVEAHADGAGVRVVHRLSHACCLKAETRLEQAGNVVTLTERLSGEPCRCRCASVIRSQAQLPPGAYDLRVRLEQPSGSAEVHRESLTVRESAQIQPKLPEKFRPLDGPKTPTP